MLHLSIVTPERPFLDEKCVSVTLPGKLGEMQVLPGHAACLVELQAGTIAYEKNDRVVVRFMVSEGFVEVDHDQVNVLCEQARFKSEIDKSQEEANLIELKEQISKADQDEAEQKRIFADLEKCVARLSLFE